VNRVPAYREPEAAILLRMAESRTALLEANHLAVQIPVTSGQPGVPGATFIAALTQAPRVALLLGFCVGAIVLGPRRTIGIAGRSGVAAWVAASARKLGQRVV
jgi:hypothetical protein